MIPPPIFYGGFFILGWAINYFWPLPLFADWFSHYVGWGLIVLSFLLAAWVLVYFYRTGTSFDSHKPSTALIRTSPFRHSRNPAYVSLSMLYVGLGIVLDNLWVLLFSLPAILITHFAVILREEAYLRRKFPNEYEPYFDKVRRWI